MKTVSVRVVDNDGRTKEWYPSIGAFIGSVVANWYNKNSGDACCNLCHEVRIGLAADCRCTKYGYSSWRQVPRNMRPWCWKWLP